MLSLYWLSPPGSRLGVFWQFFNWFWQGGAVLEEGVILELIIQIIATGRREAGVVLSIPVF